MRKHRVLKQKEFELEENKFKKDSVYYHNGNYGISPSDYEQILLTYIKNKSEYIRYEASFENYEEEITTLKQNFIKTKVKHQNKIKNRIRDIHEIKERLQISIKNWKKRYLLTSPIAGKVSFTKYWSENQAIKVGDPVATVVPSDELSIFCRLMVRPQDVGKVTKGQAVNIKLASFPHLEFGVLRGEVSYISLVPLEGKYLVEVLLPDGLKTDYNIKLPLIQQMTGIGEIITKEKRLIYKLMAGLETIRI